MLSPVRNFFKNSLPGGETKIYSVLETEFDEQRVKFVKIMRNKKLFVEVYKVVDSRPSLVDSASLGEVGNAGLKVRDTSSDLFLKDIDGVGWPELIVPVADRELNGKISVFRVDEEDFILTRL